MASQICDHNFIYSSLPMLIYLKERLYKELHTTYLLIEMINFIKNKYNYKDNLTIDVFLNEDLFHFLEMSFNNYCFNNLKYHNNKLAPKTRKIIESFLNKMREASLTHDWKTFGMHALESFDNTYRWRFLKGRHSRHPIMQKGGITFFSSYLNSTRRLEAFENLMPQPVNWVITNYFALPRLPSNRNFFWLWQFAKPRDRKFVHGDIYQHLENNFLKTWLSLSPVWQSWERIEQTMLLRLTQCWECYLQETQPRLILMANQRGIEGWFTLIAKKYNIPVASVPRSPVPEFPGCWR
jgi:hypothetical protein